MAWNDVKKDLHIELLSNDPKFTSMLPAVAHLDFDAMVSTELSQALASGDTLSIGLMDDDLMRIREDRNVILANIIVPVTSIAQARYESSRAYFLKYSESAKLVPSLYLSVNTPEDAITGLKALKRSLMDSYDFQKPIKTEEAEFLEFEAMKIRLNVELLMRRD